MVHERRREADAASGRAARTRPVPPAARGSRLRGRSRARWRSRAGTPRSGPRRRKRGAAGRRRQWGWGAGSPAPSRPRPAPNRETADPRTRRRSRPRLRRTRSSARGPKRGRPPARPRGPAVGSARPRCDRWDAAGRPGGSTRPGRAGPVARRTGVLGWTADSRASARMRRRCAPEARDAGDLDLAPYPEPPSASAPRARSEAARRSSPAC